MEDTHEITQKRSLTCATCHKEDFCIVKYIYNQEWHMLKADVIQIPDGWIYKPIGMAGGKAPYCKGCKGNAGMA